jgi:hypothetical protein
MTIKHRNLSDGLLQNRDLHFSAPKNRYVYEDFRGPFVISKQGGGAATGATGDRDILQFGLSRFEQVILGAGQTAFNPPIVAGGLNIAGDQTATEGFEITNGIDVRQETLYTIGTDTPFQFEVEMLSDDVSGTSFYVGFRKNQAYATALATYTDFATLGLVGTATTGGVITTDTGLTLADSIVKKFRVEVSSTGKVTYFVGGAVVPQVAYTFAATTQVIPFVFFLQSADLAPNVLLSSWKVGLKGEYTTPT